MVAQLIQAFRDDVASVQQWTEAQTRAVIAAADDHYYNTTSTLLTDAEYDQLRELAVSKGVALDDHVGAAPTGDVVRLPVYCGSADKIKARTSELTRFIKKFMGNGEGRFVVSDKLDGMSGTYWRDAAGHHLTSRGNGDEGTVWDHLLPYMDLPALAVGEVVRGEVVMKLAVFEDLPEPEDGKKTSARHATAGLVNKLEYDGNWKLLTFRAFGFPTMETKTSAQLKELERRGFKTAWHSLCSVAVPEEFASLLEPTYTERRLNSEFQIDGLIVTADVEYDEVTSGNPTHMAAFKMPLPEQMAETTVEFVEWNLSRYNVWVPRVKVKPVVIGGATYNWCHGENARAIVREGIGPGARVVLLRSGDVIPDLYEILERAEPQLPDGDYVWNDTDVDLLLPAGKTDDTSQIKQLSHFLTEMGMAGMKLGTVKKLYAEGYTTLPQLLTLDVRALMDVPGIKERSAQSIYNQLQRVQTEGVSLPTLMAASAAFGRGFGNTKAQSVIAAVPELINLQPLPADARIVQLVESAEDFSKESAAKFVENWPHFLDFVAKLPMVKVVAEEQNSGVLDNEVIVFTEFRNADLEDLIQLEGGSVGSGVTKKTTRVITSNPTGSTTKLKKARDMELPIQTPQEFAEQFNLSW